MPFPADSFPVDSVRQIAQLLGEFQLGEISIQSPNDGARLLLTREVVFAAPVVVETAFSEVLETVADSSDESALIASPNERFEVLAPCVGVFRAPKTAIEAGDLVKKRQSIGSVESLKVPNDISAPWDAKIVEILAFEGQGIEWGQPLLVLEPNP